jgi:2-phospho-L-lactate guanylyltransferase
VAVVPSADGGGTNVLAWRDRASFAPSFGPDSAARHLAVPGAVRVEDPGLSLDVDTVDDLRLAAGRLDPSSVTAHRLRDLGRFGASWSEATGPGGTGICFSR